MRLFRDKASGSSRRTHGKTVHPKLDAYATAKLSSAARLKTYIWHPLRFSRDTIPGKRPRIEVVIGLGVTTRRQKTIRGLHVGSQRAYLSLR